jgi:hypothetical protein
VSAAEEPDRAPGWSFISLILVAGGANLNLSVANVALPDIGKHVASSQTTLDPGESGHLRDERASEGRTPALLKDRALGALDAAVAVGASGADDPLSGGERLDGVAEMFGAELRPVVGT